ncbi:putative kh domain-containing protein [Phaeomoniella chlamydospora]|uniref:Putative kh domain-containing protein n=1 Tax=Phaeomoniella chlamydospora TaxID=158046 RepID=A0A0G2F3N2_PHACM|nr:putative kh domain-containing protein [Phaeomoniella chlamydospora]
MADQQNITNILAALAAQRPGGTPSQGPTPQQIPNAAYGGSYTPQPAPGYALPQPVSSGSVDLSAVKPVNSGSVSIADAIAKARGFAAEKGVAYDANRVPSRNDPRMVNRGYRRSRSPSRSPPRVSRDNFRDNYNPYRDERRGGNDRGYGRERSFSPQRGQHFSPPPAYAYGGGEASPTARTRDFAGSDTDSETIPVEKNLVGLIIGRSGETLRKVEQSTGARVQFMEGPESNGATRLCKISGSRAARTGAKAEIYRIIDDNGTGAGTSGKSQVKPGTAPNGENTQIMVPDRTVGLIIGRGGETIRDLQERSGCHVNIVGENKSISGLRPVNLIGTLQAQQRAKDLIMEIVESDTRTGGGNQKPDVRPPRDDPYARVGPGSGPQDKINDRIMVPGDAVGMIIGKGGESIKEMQASTGCKINVQQPQGRDVEREIQLVGSRSAIEAAKSAIMDKVDAADVRSRTDGRSGRRDDAYGDRYSQGTTQPSYQQSPPGTAVGGAPPAVGGEDPYAAYGGYQNYVAMWYAALAQQQQGQTGGQGEQPGPPGA